MIARAGLATLGVGLLIVALARAEPAGDAALGKAITADVVTTEVATIRKSMAESLSTVGKYNSGYKRTIRQQTSVLAALAVFVAEKKLDVSWKDDAASVRDLTLDVHLGAQRPGEAAYQKTAYAWARLEGLLTGKKPADLKPAQATRPLVDVVDRAAAMRRMEQAVNVLQGLNTVQAFETKESLPQMRHETAILETLIGIVGSKDFPSADERDFADFARGLERTAGEMRAAAEKQDGTAYSNGLARALKTCAACHTNFRP